MYAVSIIPSFATIRTKRAHPIRAMRAVVQRVASASVQVSHSLFLSHSSFFLTYTSPAQHSITFQVEGRTVSEIGPGLVVLVGLHESDSESDAEFMYHISSPIGCFFYKFLPKFILLTIFFKIFFLLDRCRKVLNMRLFPNESTGRGWDQNVISLFSLSNCNNG